MNTQIAQLKKFLQIMLVVFLSGGVAYLTTLLFVPGFSSSALMVGNSDWEIRDETDKITRQTRLIAVKEYPLERGYSVEVVVNCIRPGMQVPFQPRANIHKLEFEFRHFDEKKNSARLEDKYLLYRIGEKGSSFSIDTSKYNNVKLLTFIDWADPNEQYGYPNIQWLLENNTLTVRSVLAGGYNADVEIQAGELSKFIHRCMVDKQ